MERPTDQSSPTAKVLLALSQAVQGIQGRIPQGLRAFAGALWAIWTRLNDDWIFNLASLLAYNLLLSIVPILLVLIAVAGFVLGTISPAAQTALIDGIVRQLPPGVGRPLVDAVVLNLSRNAGPALIFGIASSLFLGSRLFIVVEDCFGIIFGLPPRPPLRQNLMAFAMLLVYLVLLPLIFLDGLLLDALAAQLLPDRARAFSTHIQATGLIATFLSAILLFGAIFVVVPNRQVRWREVWRGTLVSAALLVIYQQLFPLYQAHFLAPTNPGSYIGLILIIVIFFYFLAFILLLGAEVNSWASGEHATRPPVASVLLRRRLRNGSVTNGDTGGDTGGETDDAAP